jgi:branched-chain amino acid transport system permease protein
MPGYMPSVLSYAVYALLLIAVVLFLPGGIVPAMRDRLPLKTLPLKTLPLKRKVNP